jgi:hypothetical protein
MKKILLTAIAVFAFSFANAQDGGSKSEGGFKAGVNFGLPMGDIKDAYSLNIGLEAAYTWSISDEFSAGFGAGYSHYLGKTDVVKVDDASFVPVFGTAQYSFTENIFAGADLGYAIGVAPSGIDSGFYYQPKVGYQADKYEVFAGYKGVSVEGGTFSSLNLGFNYKF